MNKILVFLVLLALALGAFSCTGGAGSADAPSGENPGTPSSIQLLPAQFVAQTNSLIFLKARVFDGNGHPLGNVPVTFTNLTGGSSQVLNAASVKYSLGISGQVLSSASVVTDLDGFATASLFSSVAGFATVQAELNVGSNQVRDRKTVFFSTGPLAVPSPTLTLDVDSNDNGIFDELADFILLNGPNDNEAIIRATVFDAFGAPAPGATVTFSSDDPTEVTFPFGHTATTDSNGQASVFVEVTPTQLTDLTRPINVTASADNGAFNMLTLFLDPVTIQSIVVAAIPQTVASGATSAVTAAVTTSIGTPVPDGTTVNFTLASHGAIDAFAQTTGGVATATYSAPTLTAGSSNVTDHVTATVAGVTSASLTITTTAPPAVPTPTPTPTPTPPPALALAPGAPTVSHGAAPVNQAFAATGGTGPYIVTSSCAATEAFNDNGAGGGTSGNGIKDGTETNIWNTSGLFVVTVPVAAVGPFPESCILTVTDSVAATRQATLTISP